MSNSNHQRRLDFIEGLRSIALFYEENADAYYDGIPITLNMYVWGRDARDHLARTVRALGSCAKHYDDTNITVSRKFTNQITLSLFAPRAKVCRRSILGTRILPARILPATAEVHLPAACQDLVEWVCDPLLKNPPTP